VTQSPPLKVFIFLGPTLAHELARAECDAIYVEPAAQGDIYRAVLEQPFAIGLIDGYFERLPAVWHKEILWALAEGVHVFGAASMGALRAAELARFGMRGVGAIFNAFQDGTLEDDDEVAVAHGEASSGYRATSEAMVNIRATLREAEQARIIGEKTHARLISLAKELFYPDRSYPLLLARALEAGESPAHIDALRGFIASERVDQKRLDALALLQAVKACVAEGQPPKPSTFHFSHTDAWQQVVDWARSAPPLGAAEPAVPAPLLAAEVRLLGARGEALLARALARTAVALGTHASSTRHEAFRRLRAEQPALLASHLLDEVRVSGDYAQLVQRAQHKQQCLSKYEQERSAGAAPEPEPEGEQLLSWYCQEKLGRAVPEQLEDLLSDLGISQREELETEARREFEYSRRRAGRFGAPGGV